MTALQRQVRELVDFARTRPASWAGEWALVMRPETFCTLDDVIAAGELEHPEQPQRFAPLKVKMVEGCQAEVHDLNWDIVMIGPGLGSGPTPPHYWLDLATGRIAEWTEGSYLMLRDRPSS